jgi:HK97 family phage prohead protease
MRATHRATLSTKLKTLGESSLADRRQVRVVASTASADRVGDVIVQDGIDLTQYRKNPVVLWGHDHDRPIARCVDIAVAGGRLLATAQFPPAGADQDSDRVYGKIRAGIVNSVSVGFIPKEFEPVNRRDPASGYRFTKSELLEFSFVAVPMNADAVVIGRAYRVKPKAEREELTPRQRQEKVALLLLPIYEDQLRRAATYEEAERARSRIARAKRTLGLLPADDWRT